MEDSSDFVYYNTIIPNNTPYFVPALFQATSTQFILDKCSNYKMAVSNFNVPNVGLPLFQFDNEPNVSEGQYTVSIDGTTIPLVYRSYSLTGNPGDSIFYIGQFLDMVNEALATANSIVSGGGFIAPIMLFDRGINKFTLRVEENYKWDIWFSSKLFGRFPTLPAALNEFPPGASGTNFDFIYKIIVEDRGNNRFIDSDPNSPSFNRYFLNMEQESSCLFAMNDYQKIIITSNTMPIAGTNVGVKDGDSNSLKIQSIAEFDNNATGELDRSGLNFNSNGGSYVYHDMMGSGSLSTISYDIYIRNKDFTISRLYLAPYSQVSVKFVFVNKRCVRNYINF